MDDDSYRNNRPQSNMLPRRGQSSRLPALLLRWTYILASGLSAALLFSLQPIVTKILLPTFGGSSAVWSVVAAFFQSMLFIGYFHAYLLSRWRAPFLAALVHITLMIVGATLLPSYDLIELNDVNSKYGSTSYAILHFLFLNVGFVVFLLAIQAPFLQFLYSKSFSAEVYHGDLVVHRLYAFSNIASFGVLLFYPFVLEPVLTLEDQWNVWSAGFVVLVVLVAGVGLSAPRSRVPVKINAEPEVRISACRFGLWVCLAAVPAGLLIAVTQHLSIDVAPFPFIWMFPLAIYLYTFIVAFGEKSTFSHSRVDKSAVIIAIASVLLISSDARGPEVYILSSILILIALYFCALSIHRMFVARRPPDAQLPVFYLALALGGAAGGLATALGAPLVFTWVVELPVFFGLSLGLIVFFSFPRVLIPVKILGVFVFACIVVLVFFIKIDGRGQNEERVRSFYALHRIVTSTDGRYIELWNGRTLHGAAARDEARRSEPLTYYHLDSMLSDAIDSKRDSHGGARLRIGVVGLGTGAIACLAEKTDELTFFELDPRVEVIARTRFAFLSSCSEHARIVPGDARVSMARAEAGRFDLIVFDAFSSDSVPVHLLTREALRGAVRALAPGGVMALHISNDTLELASVIAAAARAEGWAFRFSEDDREDGERRIFGSDVAVLARAEADLGRLARSPDWEDMAVLATVAPWTDDHADLLGAIWRRLSERWRDARTQ